MKRDHKKKDLSANNNSQGSPDNVGPLSKPDLPGISRRELMKRVSLGFGFLCFPAFHRKVGLPPLKGLNKTNLRQGQFFDPCTHGNKDYNQYSDGSDCDSFDCDNDFLCEGGWWDDFECSSNFHCGTGDQENQFRCVWSYDDEDCETAYHCDWFVCESGYSAEPNSLGMGTNIGFQNPRLPRK